FYQNNGSLFHLFVYIFLLCKVWTTRTVDSYNSYFLFPPEHGSGYPSGLSILYRAERYKQRGEKVSHYFDKNTYRNLLTLYQISNMIRAISIGISRNSRNCHKTLAGA
ncbi:MAG: hypothetical protein AAFY76_23550, partial [Cyanobacteria bacterium J06649_11]